MSFLKKVNLAKITYDYADEAKDSKPKAERLSAINDLIQLLNDQRMVTQLFIPNIENVMDMIKKIFSVLSQMPIEEIHYLFLKQE